MTIRAFPSDVLEIECSLIQNQENCLKILLINTSCGSDDHVVAVNETSTRLSLLEECHGEVAQIHILAFLSSNSCRNFRTIRKKFTKSIESLGSHFARLNDKGAEVGTHCHDEH
jgi:predicted AlkP superfamily pyrophosphatase or phosphodiesterase